MLLVAVVVLVVVLVVVIVTRGSGGAGVVGAAAVVAGSSNSKGASIVTTQTDTGCLSSGSKQMAVEVVPVSGMCYTRHNSWYDTKAWFGPCFGGITCASRSSTLHTRTALHFSPYGQRHDRSTTTSCITRQYLKQSRGVVLHSHQKRES